MNFVTRAYAVALFEKQGAYAAIWKISEDIRRISVYIPSTIPLLAVVLEFQTTTKLSSNYS